jgi:hypothetical protein
MNIMRCDLTKINFVFDVWFSMFDVRYLMFGAFNSEPSIEHRITNIEN